MALVRSLVELRQGQKFERHKSEYEQWEMRCRGQNTLKKSSFRRFR